MAWNPGGRYRGSPHLLACITATAALAALPAAAGAATATSQGGSVDFTAAPGERNALTVSAFGGVVLTDANAPIAPGSGCQRGPSTRQVVYASAGVVEADLGHRADTLSVDAGLTANVIARGQEERSTTATAPAR